jgi:single-strand DNA-binding protein
MTDLITVTGIVGSDPRAITTSRQLPITSFRLASTRRFFNRATGAWEDAGTNWYTVSAFRHLAFNANASLRKGEHVLVHGRLKQRSWQAGDKSGVAVEIEADAIGHDLSWGITQLSRLEQAATGDEPDAAGAGITATGAPSGLPDGFANPDDGAGAPPEDGGDSETELEEADDDEDDDDEGAPAERDPARHSLLGLTG